MARLLGELMQQGTVARADPQALAALLYGSLAESAFWIADADDAANRLQQAGTALDLLLRGLKTPG